MFKHFRLFLFFSTILSINLRGQTIFLPPKPLINNETLFSTIRKGDIDGNGKEDLILSSYHQSNTNTDSTTGYWISNEGDGAFDNVQVLDSFSSRVFLYDPVDVNNDDDLDLVGMLRLPSYKWQLFWMENDGLGNFGLPNEIISEISFSNFDFIAMGDIDNDNDIDFCIPDQVSQHLLLLTNQSNGQVFQQEIIDTMITLFSDYMDDVEFADFDGDGYKDILVSDNNIKAYKNNANLGFDSPVQIIGLNNRNSFITGDIDNDLDIDILYYWNSYENSTGVCNAFKNNGNGTFVESETISIFNTTNKDVQFADTDDDGDLDIVYSGRYSDTINIFTNNGNGEFNNSDSYDWVENDNIASVLIDWDNDNDLDLFSISTLEDNFGKLGFFENNGNQGFNPYETVHDFTRVSTKYSHQFDVNNDGLVDVVFINLNTNQLYWVENFGAGNFDEQKLLIEDEVYNFSVADFNGDGLVDLFANSIENGAVWYKNEGQQNFLENSFVEPVLWFNSIQYTDIENDGDIDIVVPNNYENVQLYKNDGEGNFDAAQSIINIAGVAEVFTTDLNQDNLPDVILYNRNLDQIVWFENEGNESFIQKQIIADGIIGANLQSADIDNDGKLDILCIVDLELVWFRNNGNGGFDDMEVLVPDFDYLYDFVIEDFDNDDDNDIATVIRYDEIVAWYENQGQGNFGSPVVLMDLEDIDLTTLQFADLENDSDIDIISVSEFGGVIYVHLNQKDTEITKVIGQVYLDKDFDEIFNNEDKAFAGVSLSVLPENNTFYTNNNGEFTLFTSMVGQHTIKVNEPYLLDCEGEIALEVSEPTNYPFVFNYVPFLDINQDFVFIDETDNCRIISGIVFNDINQNGLQDNGETGISGILVQSDGFGSVLTNLEGEFTFDFPVGEAIEISVRLEENNLNCEADFPYYLQTIPSGNIVVSSGNDDIENLTFGLLKSNEEFDNVGITGVNIYPGNEAGETFNAWVMVESSGNINDECVLRINHSPLLSLISTEQTLEISSQGNDYIEWRIPQNEISEFDRLDMLWYLDSATVEGTILNWDVNYSPLSIEDDCSFDNQRIFNNAVISGPLRLALNDVILYSLKSIGNMPEVISNNEILSYMVTFQNPLPTTAYNVTIIDTLPHELDFNSISLPISSASNNSFTISEDGILSIFLEEINLSDASIEEVNSYGFIQFKIQLKENLEVGTTITNKATVFFNGIEPTISNSIVHRIDNSVSVNNSLNNDLEFSVFPNPTDNFVLIQSNSKLNFDVRIYDLLGSEVFSLTNQDKTQIEISTEGFETGIYIVSIFESKNDDLIKSCKLVVN